MSTRNDDDQLEKVLAQTLDRSLDAIDSDISQQLLRAREQTMAPSRSWQRHAIGFAIAASIAALIAVPLINRNTTTQPQLASKGGDALVPDPQMPGPQMPSPQMIAELDMLADMEMIEAMGEVTTESTDGNTHAGKS